MAIVNFYDDILGSVSETKKIRAKKDIKSIIQSYLDEKNIESPEYEVYNPVTGETEYKKTDNNSYKCVVKVNDREESLDYKVEKDDVIIIVFIPQSDEAKDAWDAVGITLGGFAMGIGAILAIANPATMLLGGMITFGIGAVTALVAANDYSNRHSAMKDESALEGNNLPSIKGGSNQSLLNNKYPIVIGKHLINPYIVGSPYHETHIKDLRSGADRGQYFKALYCLGYGPLKLTNFKIGTTMLAYNTPSIDGCRKTVMHGQLKLKKEWIKDDAYKQQAKNDTFDITKKWQNNDVKLEILQFGEFASTDAKDKSLDVVNKWGTIYPQSVDEQQVDASLLFAYDKAIEENQTVLYKNVSIPVSFRTNTVRFSHSCPTKIQVELDAPSGLYAVRNSTSGDATQYKQIPLHVAVQWRFASANEAASDAESSNGWNTFDKMLYDESEPVYPVSYTKAARKKEIDSNKGLSKETSPNNCNEGWIDKKVFPLIEESDNWCDVTDAEEIIKLEEDGIITVTGQRELGYGEFIPIPNSPYVALPEQILRDNEYEVAEGYESDYRIVYPAGKPTKIQKRVDLTKDGWFTKEKYSESLKEDFSIKERRFVFEKTFTEEECRIISGYENKGFLDAIEVRVIRITPCYIDQSSGDNPESYQDLLKWSYIRTWMFDKEKYVDALRTDSDSVSVNKYLSRPINEEDLKKFVYVALELKQDVAETGGPSLEQLSCIAEAFAPKYNSVTHEWSIPELNEEYSYYKKEKDDNGKWVLTDLSEDAYYNLREEAEDKSIFFRNRKGTNYIDIIKQKVYQGLNVITDYSIKDAGMVKYSISDKVETELISNNTASVALQVLFGAHLKEDAKTWNNVNKEAFADAYDFYKDITDDTPQEYTQDAQYITKAELTNDKRRKTATEMRSAGWNEISADSTDTFTTYTCGYSNDTDYYVLTPIVKSGEEYKVLSPDELNAEGNKLLSGQNSSYEDCVCAHFSGANFNSNARLYEQALHLAQEIYFLGDDTAKSYIEEFSTYPVNAVMSGCYDDAVLNFLDSYESSGFGRIEYSLLYQYVKTDTDGKTHTEGPFYSDYYDTVETAIQSGYKEFEEKKAGDDSYTRLIKIGIYFKLYNNDEEISPVLAPTVAGTVTYAYSFDDVQPESFDYTFNDTIDLSKGNYLWIKNAASPTVFKLKLKTDGIPHIYKDSLIRVMEQMNLFAESDGKLHVTFKANGVISKELKLETLLQKVLLTGRSYLKRNDFNQYEPLIGRPNPYPVTLLSQRNCISKSNSRTFEPTPSGYLVSLIDQEDNYGNNDFYVMDDGELWYAPKKKIDNLNIDYVTDRNQMRCLALFNLACKLYQRESYTRTVGKLGLGISLGDTILLQDDSLLIGTDNGARIQRLIEDDDFIYGFITDDMYHYDGDEQGVTIVQPEQYGTSRCVTLQLASPTDYPDGIQISGIKKNIRWPTSEQENDFEEESEIFTLTSGLTNLVLFKTKLSKAETISEDANSQYVVMKPKEGNLVAFGKINKSFEKVVITGIKPSKGKYELTLVPYNEELYFAGDEIPVFQPKMTIPEREPESFAFTDVPSKALYAEQDALLLESAKNLIGRFATEIVTLYKKSTEEIVTTGITSEAEYDFESKILTWKEASGNNGWSTTPVNSSDLTDGEYIYTTNATASGLNKTDVIGIAEWGTPVQSAANGISTATISLYKRTVQTPGKPEGSIVYKFSTRNVTWNEGSDRKGWSVTIPADDGNPIWIMTATASSSTDTDTINCEEFTDPVIFVKNGGYQDYLFAVGDFDLDNDQLYDLDWYDAPPEIPEGECLYMATKWIS